MRFTVVTARTVAITLAAGICHAGTSDAQAVPADTAAACVSADLPRGHWGSEAIRRLEALGAIEAQLPSGIVPLCQLQRILVSAGEARATPRSDALIGGWLRLLREEYRGPPAGAAWRVVGAVGETGVRAAEGVASPGMAEFPPDRTGAIPREDASWIHSSLVGMGILLPALWVAGETRYARGELGVTRLEAAARLGPASVRIGRGEASFTYLPTGAVVLSEVHSLDRIQMETARPIELPWILRRVGTVTFTTFLAGLSEPRHEDDPYLWGARGTVRPHSRVTLAVNRAAMFGGDHPITAAGLLDMLIGRVAGMGFENQIVSLEGRWRLPTDERLPMTAYFEWGAEDAAGAWWDVPGRIFGIYLPAVPGVPSTSLAVEHASFAQSCCSNPEWYRHWSFPGSWVSREEPLGHPLGGHGRELRIHLDSHLAGAALRMATDVFARSRGAENLYVPGREGRSLGGRLRADWRVRPSVELTADAQLETGSGWTQSALGLTGRIHF